MMTRRRFLILAGAAATPVAATAVGLRLLQDESANDGLPSVRWGEESCEHCRMVISDRRFAAAWMRPVGELHFDDIGCMVQALHNHPHGGEGRLYVRDYTGEGWLNAKTAVYFQAESVHSPMAYGVAAFADRSAGIETLGPSATPPMTWDDLAADLERRG